MPHYKLYYFPAKGRAEHIRLIFVQAGVDFEDVKIPFDEWKNMKDEMPFRQIPVLEIDGVKYCQSQAIARYLATEFGLSGKTSLQSLKADEFVEATRDVMLKYPWREKDEEKKKELTHIAMTQSMPPLLALLEENLNGEYCAGELTYGDIIFANGASYLLEEHPDILDPYPKLKALHDRVMSLPKIAKYISERDGK